MPDSDVTDVVAQFAEEIGTGLQVDVFEQR
jgi:hypothetical protein